MNYGSLSQEIEILRDLLASTSEIGIVVGGEHQSIDTMGAALALFLSLSESGKNLQIVSKKDPIVEISNLVGIDRVSKQFKGDTRQLIVSLPYVQGEVGKVSFKEDQGRINFNLTAAEGRTITPFDTQEVKLMWSGAAPALIITVGVAKIDELAGVAENARIVNIDNYVGNTRFGDMVFVDETFSSLSEIIAKIIKEMALHIDVDIAQNLMDGLSFATRNFTKPETSALSFEAAGQLMSAGAIRKVESRQQVKDTMSQIASQPRHQQQQIGQSRQDRVETGQQNQRQEGQSNRHRMQQGGNQNRFAQQSRNPVNNPIPNAPRQNQNMNVPISGAQSLQAPPKMAATTFEEPTPTVIPSSTIDNTLPPMPAADISNDMTSRDDTNIPNDWLIPKVFKGSKPQNSND